MHQGFLLQILLLAQHVSGITMPISRSSGVLYSGCCVWYFVQTGHITLSSTPDQLLEKTTAQNTTRSNHCIILLSSWWWAKWCPKHVEQEIRSAIKTSVASSWHFISTDVPRVNTTASAASYERRIQCLVNMCVMCLGRVSYRKGLAYGKVVPRCLVLCGGVRSDPWR